MEFSPVCSDDLQLISQLTPPGWTDVEEVFTRYLKMSEVLTLKLKEDEQIIGLGAAICLGDSAWLAHIIVDKNKRGRGLGFQIVSALLAQLKTMGIEKVSLLATEEGAPVYRRAGFVTTAAYQYFKSPGDFLSSKTSRFLRPFDDRDQDEIVKMDRAFSGEDRSGLLLRYLSEALIFEEDSTILGYYLPQWGEGLIVAQTTEAGTSLMLEKAKGNGGFGVPEGNQIAIDWLERQGFVRQDKYLQRMSLGEPPKWKADWCYSRIGGNLG